MLLALALVPVVVSVVLGLTARRLSRWLPPATAAKLLPAAALAAALASGFCLSVLAFNAVASLSTLTRLGHWALAADPDDGTPSPASGIVLAVIVAGLLASAMCYALRTLAAAVRTAHACRHLRTVPIRPVIVDDAVADAFTLPGRRGGIVITTAMLDALDPAEQEVLIAHERAHQIQHHPLLAALAASANPFLIPVTTQVRTLTERWADEVAASAVHDRDLVARAVGRAALARTSTVRRVNDKSSGTLGVADHSVVERVQALHRPRPRPRPYVSAALAALVIAALAASAGMARATEMKFEHAAVASNSAIHTSTAPARHR